MHTVLQRNRTTLLRRNLSNVQIGIVGSELLSVTLSYNTNSSLPSQCTQSLGEIEQFCLEKSNLNVESNIVGNEPLSVSLSNRGMKLLCVTRRSQDVGGIWANDSSVTRNIIALDRPVMPFSERGSRIYHSIPVWNWRKPKSNRHRSVRQLQMFLRSRQSVHWSSMVPQFLFSEKAVNNVPRPASTCRACYWACTMVHRMLRCTWKRRAKRAWICGSTKSAHITLRLYVQDLTIVCTARRLPAFYVCSGGASPHHIREYWNKRVCNLVTVKGKMQVSIRPSMLGCDSDWPFTG